MFLIFFQCRYFCNIPTEFCCSGKSFGWKDGHRGRIHGRMAITEGSVADVKVEPVAISLIRSLLELLYQSFGQGSRFQHRYLIPILHPPFIQRVSPPPCVMLLKQKEQHYDERSRKGLEAPTYNIRCVMPATVCPTGRSYEKSSARQPKENHKEL